MGEEENQEEEKEEEVEEEEEEDETHNYNGVFCCNTADLYSWAKAIFFFPMYKEGENEGEEEDKKREEEEVKEEVEEEVEEKEITTAMQSSAVVQQSCTCGEGNCSFLSIE